MRTNNELIQAENSEAVLRKATNEYMLRRLHQHFYVMITAAPAEDEYPPYYLLSIYTNEDDDRTLFVRSRAGDDLPKLIKEAFFDLIYESYP